MIPYAKALDLLLRAEKLSPISLPINNACGSAAAQNIVSEVHIPPWANASMDGFAVRSDDLADASEKNPITLSVMGSSAAGDAPSGSASRAIGAWEIMTGAPVPEGYDAVVQIEKTIISQKNAENRVQKITFTQAPSPKNNIRLAGEDFAPGDLIIESGALISPFHVMALAAAGQKNIMAAPQPRVAVFSTGKELADDMNAPLLPGQIRDSNSPYLMAAFGALPVQARHGGVIHDEPEIFEEKIRQAWLDTDIFISTGAVSEGRHDFIPDSLRKLGAEILFHKIAVRPGKPILYARFPNGAHYFGLPGNPVSAAAGLRFFVVPLLRHMQGMSIEKPLTARLLTPHPKKQGWRIFCKACLSISAEEKLQVEILKGQESFKIHPLLAANCWAVFAENQNGADAGDKIAIYPLTPGQWNIK